MDEIVKAALAKWPGVPDCYGWLGLDARGNWFMRDDRAQAAGPFAGEGASAQSKGSLLKHEKLIDFIQRNYESNALGQWFFQNGPQRVYVELESAPWIWRINANLSVQDHAGKTVNVQEALVDEKGYLYLLADTGFGLVHTQDMNQAAEAVEQGVWRVQEVNSVSLTTRFAYVKSPSMLQK